MRCSTTCFAAVAVYNPDVDDELITRAFVLACVKHGGQSRKSGEDFINHPVGTALHRAPSCAWTIATIAAALLHDVVEDTDTPIECIRGAVRRRDRHAGRRRHQADQDQLQLDRKKSRPRTTAR